MRYFIWRLRQRIQSYCGKIYFTLERLKKVIEENSMMKFTTALPKKIECTLHTPKSASDSLQVVSRDQKFS